MATTRENLDWICPRTVLDSVRVLDAILLVLLLVGNMLALPLWWWLFGAPFVRFWKSHRVRKRSSRF